MPSAVKEASDSVVALIVTLPDPLIVVEPPMVTVAADRWIFTWPEMLSCAIGLKMSVTFWRAVSSWVLMLSQYSPGSGQAVCVAPRAVIEIVPPSIVAPVIEMLALRSLKMSGLKPVAIEAARFGASFASSVTSPAENAPVAVARICEPADSVIDSPSSLTAPASAAAERVSITALAPTVIVSARIVSEAPLRASEPWIVIRSLPSPPSIVSEPVGVAKSVVSKPLPERRSPVPMGSSVAVVSPPGSVNTTSVVPVGTSTGSSPV